MDEVLLQLQQTQIEILNVIDAVCKRERIEYSLYAGTLLGAVRHQGFIPWDDDLDICMKRSEYDRFLDAWNANPVDGYLLQNKENSPAFSQSFSKIRKDHTCFLQDQEPEDAYHTGIFVDIFPIDRIPNGTLQRMLFVWRCMRYQLYTREFAPQTGNPVVIYASKLLLAVTSHAVRMRQRESLLKKLTKYNDDGLCQMVGIETMASIHSPYPGTMLDCFTLLPFGDNTYPCPAGWDEVLQAKYGDYMTLPPESERAWKHRPLAISFEKNYGEM